MQFLNDVLLQHQSMDFVIEIGKPGVSDTFEHFYPRLNDGYVTM